MLLGKWFNGPLFLAVGYIRQNWRMKIPMKLKNSIKCEVEKGLFLAAYPISIQVNGKILPLISGALGQATVKLTIRISRKIKSSTYVESTIFHEDSFGRKIQEYNGGNTR